ncbi:MAG: hypothetical protein ACR2MQ_03990 [Gemmatimonadaceae bacterium]
MNSDGVPYLDVSDTYLNGTWRSAFNAYWSPGYPALIAAVRKVIGEGPANDYPAAHLTVFLLFLVAFGALEFLMGTLMARDASSATADMDRRHALFLALGYSLFLWCALALITFDMITPDMGVAACVFVAAALAVRIASAEASLWIAVVLGMSLGLGYLVKAVMFPVSVGLLALVIVTAVVRRRALWQAGIALAVFLAISTPQVISVSRAKGSFTFSESGKLVHGWYVDGVPCPLWATTTACLGPVGGAELSRVHSGLPYPRMHRNPAVFAFGAQTEGTYPAWYDATFWYHDLHTLIQPRRQVVVLANNLAEDWTLVFPLAVALVAFLLLSGRRKRWRAVVSEVAPNWLLVLTAVGVVGMYAFVYTEPRYTGPFVVLLALGLCASTSATATNLTKALLAAAVLLAAQASVIALRDAWWERGADNPNLVIADELHRMGVPAGSTLGVIGNGYVASFWARPARVRVTSEIYPSEATEFWSADTQTQRDVIDAFRRTGAQAVVAMDPPAWASLDGWVPVRKSDGLMLLRLQGRP